METYKSHRRHFIKVILFWIFILTTLNTSHAAGKCREGCPSSLTKSGKYNYAPGSIYSYNLDSTITIFLSGNDAQETQVRVQGVAQLYVEGNCDYTLRLQRLIVFNPDGKKTTLGAEISNPIKFILTDDGEVIPEICSETDDNEYILNLKKAIISIIQSADHKQHETDVFGTCPTISSTTQTAGTTIVSRVRNLNLCSHRETLVSGFITSVVNENAGIHASPLLNGDYTNEQRIRNGVLESAVINEEYHFVPFSAGESGARAKVQTILKLSGSSAGQTPKLKKPISTTILFSSPNQNPISNLNNVKTILKNTLAAYSNNVGPKAAAQFTDLIRIMRVTTSEDLRTLYQHIKSKSVSDNVSLTRKIYFDALFRTGTAESVEVCTTLLRSGELNEQELKLVYLSLNLVHTMTKDALNNVNKLLDGNPPKEAYLTVGNLVARYCRTHSCDSVEVKNILDKFNSKLNMCKAENRVQEDTVVAVLKGLRNTENLMGAAMDRVVQCAGEKSSTRIRIAAIQALAAAGVNQKSQTYLLNLLKNYNEDSEVRIEAYLALVANPTGNLGNEIKNLIEDEPIYQVGSFITTHLAALRASVDPNKEAARQILGGIRPVKKFPNDFRRYSFNHEYSYAVDSLGVGASLDTNVIYSQKSFLPRSGTLNFTGEIFGNSFNLFELNARQENLDHMVEHYFGPKGVLRTKTEQEIFNKLTEIFGGGVEEPGHRQRRGAKEDAIAFAKTVNLGNEQNRDIDLDFSMKLFGSEMFFLSLGHYTIVTPEDMLHNFKQCFIDGLKKSENYNKIFENHALFLDADLVYPTSIGLPIKLHAQGSSVVRLEAKSVYDIEAIRETPKNAKINIKFVPSANILVSGTLSVDAYTINVGLQVNAAVHTSTGVNIELAVTNDGDGVNLNVLLPLKKQEIFSFDHKIVFITQEKDKETVETPLKFTSKTKDFNGCFDQLFPYLGATFCADVEFTVPGSFGVAPFPLNGPNKFIIYLEVEENFNFDILNRQGEGTQNLILSFDTPGSKINRKASLELAAGVGELNYLRVHLLSPFKNAMAEVGIKNDKTELTFYAKGLNNADEYLGKVGFNKEMVGRKMGLTPVVLVRTPGSVVDNIMGYKAEGKIYVEDVEGGKKYTFDNIRIISTAQTPITINGDVLWKGPSITTNLAFANDKNRGTLNGMFEYKPDPISINFDLALKTTFDESINGRISFVHNRTPLTQKTTFIFVYGSDLESKRQRIEYNEYFEMNESKIPIKLNTGLIIGFIPAHLKYSLEAPSENDIKWNFDVRYTKYNVKNNFHLVKNPNVIGAYDFTLGGAFNEHNFKLISKLAVDGQKNQLTNKFVTSSGFQAELKGTIGQKFTDNEMDVDLTAIVKFDDKQEPYKVIFILNANPKVTNSNAKFLIGKQEYASYDVKLTKEQTKTAKIDFNVRDILVGKGEFKAVNNKGDGFILINLQKVERKVRTDVKFNIGLPTFDVTTDFYYDFEKDNTKKISFTTKSTIEQTKFDSKNTLEVFNEKYTLNGDGQLIGQVDDGTLKGKFIFTLPTGRSISSEIIREIHLTKLESVNGHVEIKIDDRLPNKKSRGFVFNAKVNKGNFRARQFDLTHSLKYTDFDNKMLQIESNIKNLPKGNFKTAGITLTAKGSLLSEIVEVTLFVDEYDQNHAMYTVSGKYGNQYIAKLNGGYDIGGRAIPSTFRITSSIDIPTGKVKSIRFDTEGSLLRPEIDGGMFGISFKTQTSIDNKALSFDIKTDGNDESGNLLIYLNIPDVDPLSTEIHYVRDDKPETTKLSTTFAISYGKGKQIKGQTESLNSNNRDHSFSGTMTTPFKNANNLHFSFKNGRSIEDRYTTNVKIIADGKEYGWNGAVVLSNSQSEIDFDVVCPTKPMRFYIGFKRLGQRKHKAALIMKNIGDMQFDGQIEASYDTFDTFYLTADVDSTTLKLNNIHVEVNAKPGSAGKGVVFKATSNGNNILDGSTDFSVKEEKGKTVVTGQGNVKLYDKQRAAKFDFVRTNFDMARDGETGVLFTFNGNFGPKNIVGEFKMTDRNFLIKHTVCEEKKQCINLEVKSSMTKLDVESFKHDIDISIDLRELGYSHQFGLQSTTERHGIFIDHTFNIHFHSDDKPKYQYQFYLHPKSAGIELTLPSRVIAVESKFTTPQDVFGKYDMSLAFYADKRANLNRAVIIRFVGDLIKSGKTIMGKYDFQIIHPSLRPFMVTSNFEFNPDRHLANGHVEFDIFRDANQKITINGNYGGAELTERGFNTTTDLSITSAGLNLDYNFNGHSALSFDKRQFSMAGSLTAPRDDVKFSSYVFVSSQFIEILVNGFNEELLNANVKYDVKTHVTEKLVTIKFLGSTPIVMKSKLTGITSYVFDLKRGKLLNVNGELTVGKEARLEINGAGKQLFKGKVQLNQNHFLASEYNVQDQEVKEFLKTFQDQMHNDVSNARNELDGRITKAQGVFNDKLRAAELALPDFDKIAAGINSESKQIADELLADQTTKEMIDSMVATFKLISETFKEISQIIFESFNKMAAIVLDFYAAVQQVFIEKVLPSLKELYQQIEYVIFNIYEETVKLFSALFERTIKSLKAFEDDFNKIGKTFGEIFKNLAALVNKYIDVLRKELNDLIELLMEQIKTCPGFDGLKEKYYEIMKTYSIPEQIIGLVKEMAGLIHYVLPTSEVNIFIGHAVDYVEAKLHNRHVDDAEHLKTLYITFIDALKSIITMITSQAYDVDTTTSHGLFAPLPFSWDTLRNIPVVSNLRFSPYNYLKTERTHTLREMLTQYRPHGFEMFNFLPPFTMRGQISDGEHYFTFDGRHYTFPGKCSYILAQDFEHNNFSLIATLNNGKMKSITLIDKGDFVEVNDLGLITLNGKASDLPVHQNNIHVWREYYSIYLYTEYGVEVFCSMDLRVCHFSVSGFYLGKVRGLLGNGNGEPYDDFTLPNNKIIDNFADFGNSYKSGRAACQPVPFVDHSHHHGRDEQCNEFFSSDSSLRMCFYFVDPTNYREACEHAAATTTNKLDATCNIVKSYVSACRKEKIPIDVPSKCATCDGGKKNIGDSFTVKVPQKESDIVLVVDTSDPTILTDFAQNLIIDLRKELKAREITDTKITIIGYNKKQKYISLFTDKGKLDYNGKLLNAKLNGPKIPEPLVTGNPQLDEILKNSHMKRQTMREELAQSADAKAFQMAFKFPFRATATKTIIAIRGDSLQYSANPAKILSAVGTKVQVEEKGIQLHLVTPIEFTIIGKDQKVQAKNIVGFNNKVALTMVESKKKFNFGSAELRRNLKFEDDLGIALVVDSDGYVYNLQNYMGKVPKDKKAFMTVMAGSLADQISRTEILSDCICKLNYGLFAEEDCKVQSKKLIPSKKPGQRG